MEPEQILILIGAASFGLVIGWVVSGSYVGLKEVNLTWISSLIGVIGGGAVVAIFKDRPLFAAYCIGLAISFLLGCFFQGNAGRFIAMRMGKVFDEELRLQTTSGNANRLPKSTAQHSGPTGST